MTGSPPPAIELGTPGPLRDQLVAAVLSGAKTATTSLLAEWEHDGEPLPAPGTRHSVIDSAGAAVAVIELVAIDVMRLGDADDRLAHEEGEGFADAAAWRAAHEDFWRTQALPSLPGEVLSNDTPVVVERFRLVGP